MNNVNEPIKLYVITLRTITFYTNKWKKCDSPLCAPRPSLLSFFTTVDMVVCDKKITWSFAVWLGRRLSNAPWLNWTQTVTTNAHKNTMAPSAIAEVHFLLDISSANNIQEKCQKLLFRQQVLFFAPSKEFVSIHKEAVVHTIFSLFL